MTTAKTNPHPWKTVWPLLSAAAVGLAFILFVAILFQPPPSERSAPPVPPTPKIRLGNGEADLHDPTYLFLPNALSSAQRTPARPQEESFADNPEEFAVSNVIDFGPGTNPTSPPSGPLAALQRPPLGANPLIGFGRTDAVAAPLAQRAAFISVAEARTGNVVYTYSVPHDGDSAPELPQPLEFMAAVDSAGLASPLVPTERSGTKADAYYLDYLTRVRRIGDRLAPGFYRISVGP
jgi:hypothetical protein